MEFLSLSRAGLLRKVTVALCAVLVALTGSTVIAIRSTQDATVGAQRVEDEFAERVKTGNALSTALANRSIAQRRLLSPSMTGSRAQDAALAGSDTQLAVQLSAAIDRSDDDVARDAQVVGPIRRAYARYQAARLALLRARRSGASAESLASGLDEAFEPLQASLQAYADLHFREGRSELAELRQAGDARDLQLALVLGFGVLSVLAILLVIRDIVRRVRGYASFAGHVAEGDLTARLGLRGRDELAGLARSLNAMVEQLAASAKQRRDTRADEVAYRAAQDGFSEILQVAETESEAHEVLKLHLERAVDGSQVVVLNRNNSEDRLEATTPLAAGSPLAEPLQTAAPRSCLAVRLARPYGSESEIAPLLECEVCGVTAERSRCLPLLVSGEVIGSVLVNHRVPFDAGDERCVSESVAQAAPTLANLRNLALAEARAATDSLTGLPNRRAIQDTVKRMLAHSSRSLTPMAAIMLDLDHFKQINDTFGHEEGDAVLAAVGDALASTVRTSDFVGRSGGEEFVVLMPDTDAQGALEVAEKLRSTIAAIKVPRAERAISASFGVAVHPDAAGDAETLLRLADRALYAAKAGGRDRIELAAPITSPVGVGLGPAVVAEA